MPNTPASRPDGAGIAARAVAVADVLADAAPSGGFPMPLLVPMAIGKAFRDIPTLIAWIEKLEARQVKLEAVVAEQAADDGLWFQAQTAPEAYLQQALRELHEIIEGKTSVECAEKTLVQMFEEGRNQPYD